MTIQAIAYSPDLQRDWDKFVDSSKNGMFLFNRNFQDYHRDRFVDSSLVFKSNDQILGVLPASRHDREVISHGGLTYGGLVTNLSMSTALMLSLFEAMMEEFRKRGISRIEYKTIPHWHQRYASDEDLYALFRNNALVCRRDLGFVLEPRHQPPKHAQRTRSLKKAKKAGVTVAESHDFEAYWRILASTLESRHHVRPVHSLDEIRLLKERFPSNIRLFMASLMDEPVAGTLIFEHPNVAHTQYIAASPVGRTCCALDALFEWLIVDVFKDKRWFSFGAATEAQGWILNEGLAGWKETFGARAVALDSYELTL